MLTDSDERKVVTMPPTTRREASSDKHT